MKNNYMQIVEPDFFIKIGIKDDHVISFDWSELLIANPMVNKKEIYKLVSKYLKQASKGFSEKKK